MTGSHVQMFWLRSVSDLKLDGDAWEEGPLLVARWLLQVLMGRKPPASFLAS